MNPTRASEVRAWMAEHGFEPSKSLGQNFLVDANLRDQIIRVAGVGPEDEVVEIGPGLGALTGALVDRAAKVTAVEIDSRLADELRARFSERRNFTLIHSDALKVDLRTLLAGGTARVVSNLPYSVGSRILFELADGEIRPRSITVAVQREVADRLAAAVDSDDYGLLSVWMQSFYQVKVVRGLPPGCFMPPPRVDSAVVHLERLETPRCGPVDIGRYALVVKKAFEQRRKQLGSVFRKATAPLTLAPETLAAAGIDPMARAETLAPEQWGVLCRLTLAG